MSKVLVCNETLLTHSPPRQIQFIVISQTVYVHSKSND